MAELGGGRAMKHLHILKRVPAHRVDELLDAIWKLAEEHGTFKINELIDEYREDVYLVVDHKENHHGSSEDRNHLLHLRVARQGPRSFDA